MGTQIAWWQLGFTERRAVVRSARKGDRHPDPDTWTDAQQWARQMLDAPWWWRLARAIVISGFAVLGVAATASVAVEFQAEYAISAAVLTVAPLAVAWAWRQTHNARLIDQVEPTERGSKANPRWVPVVLLAAAIAAMTTSVAVIIGTVQANHDDVYGCPLRPQNEQILAWWVKNGGRSGLAGCPTLESGFTAVGEPYLRTATGVVTMTHSVGGIFLPAELFDAWQANRSTLGDPIWGPLVEGPVRYVNFRNGYVSYTEGEPPLAVIGRSYRQAQLPGGPCVAHDRPCLVRAERDGTTIHLAWHWRTADAFNVSWHLPGGTAVASVEVAGNEYVMTGTRPDVTFVIQLQACDKRFLSSSICSPVASYVISPETR